METIKTPASINGALDVLIRIAFLDLYSKECCHINIRKDDGLAFVNVAGIVDNGQQGTIRLNPPVDRKSFEDADEDGKIAIRQSAGEWCKEASRKITALAESGLRRIPLDNAAWIASEVVNKNGRICGDVVRADRSAQLKPRWKDATNVPASVDNSDLDDLPF